MNPYSQEKKSFSIISPCYGNDWERIQTNIEYLLKQEYKEFEWIVVFDGESKDGEREMKRVIKKYPKLDISYCTIEHGGACAARNFGATKAKGDYLCFLNVDNYLYPEALRIWANVFETKPHINRVWGSYDLIDANGNKFGAVSGVPRFPNGKVWYKAFKFTNYCDSSFPIRKEAYIEWDTTVKSLNDWDWVIRQLQRDNFEGADFEFIDHAFFLAEAPEPGGLSDDSHKNWLDRTDYIRNKNGIPKSDICVVSHGAAHHGFHIAEKLGADYLPMPSFKPHRYKMVYLIGFYTAEAGGVPVTASHMQVFQDFKGVKVIHWIGTDILQLRWNCSFEKIKALKQWFKDENIINLSEIDFAQKELAEVGIKTTVIPIPTKQLNDRMLLPEKFSVAIYESSVSPMYNTDFMEEIVKSMPDIQFYFFGDDSKKGEKGENYEHLGYIDMNEWMSKFSCNLRVTVHDGLALLIVEFITAGRSAIANIPMPGVIQVTKDRKRVIDAIRHCQDNQPDPKWVDYWKEEMDYDKYKKAIYSLMSSERKDNA